METGGLHEKAFETGKIDLGDQYNFLTRAFSPPARKPHCVWFCRRTSFRLSGFTTSRSEGRTRFNQCWSSILGRGALIDLQVGIGLTTFAQIFGAPLRRLPLWHGALSLINWPKRVG